MGEHDESVRQKGRVFYGMLIIGVAVIAFSIIEIWLTITPPFNAVEGVWNVIVESMMLFLGILILCLAVGLKGGRM